MKLPHQARKDPDVETIAWSRLTVVELIMVDNSTQHFGKYLLGITEKSSKKPLYILSISNFEIAHNALAYTFTENETSEWGELCRLTITKGREAFVKVDVRRAHCCYLEQNYTFLDILTENNFLRPHVSHHDSLAVSAQRVLQ